MNERSYLSIGDVLALLRDEFPDITISKIRFLESRGLLVPERTPSGYRKFYDHDVDRLRWILRQQREHFLPLKVIKGRLEGSTAASEPESLFDPAEPSDDDLSVPARGQIAALPVQNGSAHPSTAASVPTERVPAGVATIARHGRESEQARETAGYPGATASAHSLGRRPSDLGEVSGKAPEGSPERPESQGDRPRALTSSQPHEGSAEKASTENAADTGAGKASPAGPASGAGTEPAVSPGEGIMAAGELAQASGLSVRDVEALESFGLIEGRTIAGVRCFDEDALVIASLAANFAQFGIEARHLRIFKHAAERQAGLYAQVVTPLLRQRNPQARTRALESLEKLSSLGTSVQACLLRSSLKDLTGG